MRILSLVALTLFSVANCSAAMISISPPNQTSSVGSNVAIEAGISGLGVGTAPSVGVYDLTVSYDPAILSFSSVLWGNGLDVLGLGSLQSATPGVGIVNLFELSFDLADDLNDLQPDAFRLFTLNFSSLAGGTTPITITVKAIGDADGVDLPVTVVKGAVTVGTVPEPATALPVLGVLTLGWVRLRRCGFCTWVPHP